MNFTESLIEARLLRRPLARPSAVLDNFDLNAGYGIAAEADARLRARGWRHAGRKLGFTNRATWSEFDLATPIWAYVYDRTVIAADGDVTAIPVSDLVAPRIEPEIVLGLNDQIIGAGSAPGALAGAIEWVAPGFEIVDCHFPGWKFNAADIVADFGAHARLVIGPKTKIADHDRTTLAATLGAVAVELRRGTELIDTGVGTNALGGPLAGLGFLVDALSEQTWASPLTAGEVVTTGTLTSIPFVSAGEQWTAAFSGAALGELTIRLI